MLLKLLQTSIKHGEKAQQVKEQYEDGFKFFDEDESLKDEDSMATLRDTNCGSLMFC